MTICDLVSVIPFWVAQTRDIPITQESQLVRDRLSVNQVDQDNILLIIIYIITSCLRMVAKPISIVEAQQMVIPAGHKQEQD